MADLDRRRTVRRHRAGRALEHGRAQGQGRRGVRVQGGAARAAVAERVLDHAVDDLRRSPAHVDRGPPAVLDGAGIERRAAAVEVAEGDALDAHGRRRGGVAAHEHAAAGVLARSIEELIDELKGSYSVLIVTHNMQQASRTSDDTAFMYLGRLVEFGPTSDIFVQPRLKETEDYVTGRFG